MSRNSSFKKVKAFTLIELVIAIVIIGIISVTWYELSTSMLNSQKDENEISSIYQLWSIFSNIILKKWDIPNSYCKLWDWTYWNNLQSCISEPSYVWACDWTYWDLINNIDCNKGCLTYNCSNWRCTSGFTYYDFEKLVRENTNFHLDFNEIYNNFSYKICPSEDNSKITIWKANESLNKTFNPSFTFFHKWVQVYFFNSNP